MELQPRWHVSTPPGATSGSIRRLVQDGQRQARIQRRDDAERRHVQHDEPPPRRKRPEPQRREG